MNIHNLVLTLIFCCASADLDIAGDISFDLLIHQNRNCRANGAFQEYDISTNELKKQTLSTAKQLSSDEKSNEENNENTRESQEKNTLHTIKEIKMKKFKYQKLKLEYARPKKNKFNILRTVKVPEGGVKKKLTRTTLNNSLNVSTELQLDGPIAELNKTIDSQETKQSFVNVNNKTLTIMSHRTTQSNEMVTSAPLLQCVYQYPEEDQINTLLSDMTNLLTKLCTQTNGMTPQRSRRWAKKRFRVVEKMDASAFERSFLHMVKEFKQSCNKITERLNVQNNPCEHQKELKTTWKKLLKYSEATLQRAALQCARELLRTRSRAEDSSSMQALGEALVKELSNVRFRHLEVLCDQFQLCYNDLL